MSTEQCEALGNGIAQAVDTLVEHGIATTLDLVKSNASTTVGRSLISKSSEVVCEWDSVSHWSRVLGHKLISPKAARRLEQRRTQDKPVGFASANKVFSTVVAAMKDKDCNPDQRLADFMDAFLSCKSKQHFNDARRAEL